jgi:alditol oxidase
MRNWAGNYAYRARRLHEPRSIDELQQLVRTSTSLRAIGSRHSFNDVADTHGDLVSVASMPRIFELNRSTQTVAVDGGTRYGDFCAPLDRAGFALHNLGSLPHISVAGSCATGTHGSGVTNGNLATAVVAAEIVRGDGELVVVTPAEPRSLRAAAVSIGCLGVITRLTLAAEPAYHMQQDVFEDLPLDAFVDHFPEIVGVGDSVSFFTRWSGQAIDQVWVKRRVDPATTLEQLDLFGATAATRQRHPIPGFPPEACTPQLGVPGPWFERLPHFRMDHTPSSGDELQSEYFVGREHAIEAFLALHSIREAIAPLIQVSEIRSIAEDDLFLSPATGQPSIAFHFTWLPDWPSVRELLPLIERALEPFDPRPHWGKLFTLPPETVRAGYASLSDFVAVAEAFDPAGTFRNAFVDRYVFGGSSSP